MELNKHAYFEGKLGLQKDTREGIRRLEQAAKTGVGRSRGDH